MAGAITTATTTTTEFSEMERLESDSQNVAGQMRGHSLWR